MGKVATCEGALRIPQEKYPTRILTDHKRDGCELTSSPSSCSCCPGSPPSPRAAAAASRRSRSPLLRSIGGFRGDAIHYPPGLLQSHSYEGFCPSLSRREEWRCTRRGLPQFRTSVFLAFISSGPRKLKLS